MNSYVFEWGEIATDFGPIQILTPTQTVMDRPAAWFHRSDPQSLEQALLVAKSHPPDIATLRVWAEGELSGEGLHEFLRLLGS